MILREHSSAGECLAHPLFPAVQMQNPLSHSPGAGFPWLRHLSLHLSDQTLDNVFGVLSPE